MIFNDLNDFKYTLTVHILLSMVIFLIELWSRFKALAMKDLTLPIMILTQPNLQIQKSHQPKTDTPNSTPQHYTAAFSNPAYETNNEPHPSPSSLDGRCELEFCDGDCLPAVENTASLFEPFLMVLSNCNKPAALYNVILPVINRSVFIWCLVCLTDKSNL